ncbi:MAG TPA: pirin family protein [Acidimicrobiales bacterium]
MTLDENEGSTLDVLTSHHAQVGSFTVRRALPQRARRTVGAWCFADHMGPADVTEGSGLDIGPHPHTGLQTVTWLVDGQLLHRDSLGSEQVISAGELNLMTAGHGVSHAEEATGHYRGVLQGIQLWIAQDDATREAAAGFEHHDDLPRVEVGEATATVLIGRFHDATSPARTDSPLVGADLRLRGTSEFSLNTSFEYGVIVLEGLIDIDGRELGPGTMGYVAPGRDELRLDTRRSATVIVLGGEPLDSPIFMWWNFVARTRAEIDVAYESWRDNDGRFGKVDSPLARVETSAPYWQTREN